MTVMVSSSTLFMHLQAPALESAESPSATPFVGPPPGRTPTRGCILHVDDDPMARMIFSGWLPHHGYAHHHAADPAEADALLSMVKVDLILSDIHMPGNRRLEWVEELLARADAPAVILLTGQPEFETACRAANLPVAGYLLKPADLASLDATLQRVLHAQRRRADFLSLSHDILRLLETRGLQGSAEENFLVSKLARLAGCFGSRPPDRTGGEAANYLLWRAAVTDTIAVIEGTRHSFRSRELGQLRVRLQDLLRLP